MNSMPAFVELPKRLPVVISMPLGRTVLVLSKQYDEVEKDRQKLLDQYALTNEHGRRVLAEDGKTVVWRDEAAAAEFLKEWREVLATTIDIEVFLVPLEKLPEVDFEGEPYELPAPVVTALYDLNLVPGVEEKDDEGKEKST
jgi:hypothetical protein